MSATNLADLYQLSFSLGVAELWREIIARGEDNPDDEFYSDPWPKDPRRCGRRNHSKIDAEDARYIREHYIPREVTLKHLASQRGISEAQAWNIVHGKQWGAV